MRALIDGDLVAYRCAASAKNESLDVATWRVEALLRQLIRDTNSTEYIIYLSGPDNFRKGLDPTYKAHRTQERPAFLEDCREYLVKTWGAKVTEGIEADDAIGIEATACFAEGTAFICCSLDKDFRQIPGHHHSWEISGTVNGKSWTKPAETVFVSPLDGLRNFYKQMLIGDPADNVTGVVGIGKVKAAKLIDPLHTEEDMARAVIAFYDSEERYELNRKLLWILRNELNLQSKNPLEKEIKKLY
jgi:5'-3' exonuclease